MGIYPPTHVSGSLSIQPQWNEYRTSLFDGPMAGYTDGPASIPPCPVRLDSRRPRPAPPCWPIHWKPGLFVALRSLHQRFWGCEHPAPAVRSSNHCKVSPGSARLRCPALLSRYARNDTPQTPTFGCTTNEDSATSEYMVNFEAA